MEYACLISYFLNANYLGCFTASSFGGKGKCKIKTWIEPLLLWAAGWEEGQRLTCWLDCGISMRCLRLYCSPAYSRTLSHYLISKCSLSAACTHILSSSQLPRVISILVDHTARLLLKMHGWEIAPPVKHISIFVKVPACSQNQKKGKRLVSGGRGLHVHCPKSAAF